ncbi:MAG: FAD-dependent oxidoreductase [Proteobacteria bacterium]|nr:FAD-dependent oxidoreductase [Pseudomonadota bacterium]
MTNITRKDFLNGIAWTAGAAMLPAAVTRALESGPDASAEEYFLSQGIGPSDPRYYPPALTGMRGSHPGSFETGHALRDGTHWDEVGAASETGEHYDLIVVGGGISGLSTAYFFRKLRGPKSKILILDNHDDFGGHAKRNEFTVGGKTLIGYGGTQSIEALSLYTPEAMGLLRELGIDIQRFEKYYDQNFRRSHGLRASCFFDRGAFGVDKLCAQRADSVHFGTPTDPHDLEAFLAAAPLAEQAKRDLRRLHFEKVDYLAGKSAAQKKAVLEHISIKTFLEQHAHVHADVVKYYQQRTHGLFGVGIDAVPALSGLWFMPEGVKTGLALSDESGEMGAEPYIYHFPDGNASIARMLVRALVSGAAPGSTMEDIVTARMNYAALDQASSGVRIRLNSTAVRVKHVGDPAKAEAVDVVYVNAGKAHRVRGAKVVLACWNVVIPYLCPEMPQAQREGLAYCVKVPLVYGTVAIQNWNSLKRLGAGTVYCPASYFSEVNMDFPVSIGSYHYTQTPDDPCLIHLVRTPCKPGLSTKEQHRAGRAELFTTPFETFEHHVRDQLGRMFAAGGFDPARDIRGITINRWPHGYAYDYSTLWDPQWLEGQAPHLIGRKPFGRIAIANADSGAVAETSSAIEQALRACREVLAMPS